jgi:hypothetical protein
MSQHKNKNQLRHHRKQRWPMVLFFAGGLLLIIAFVSAFIQSSSPKVSIEVNGTPSLKVDREKVDLGNVKLGQTVQVKFTLMNVGDQALNFSQAPYVEVLEGC